VAKPEWGAKRFCQSCGARYYDLLRTPPTCPKCGTVFEAAKDPKAKRKSAVPATGKIEDAVAVVPEKDDVKKVSVTPGEEDLDDLDAEDSEGEKAGGDDLMEDTSDLGEDDDDMSEIKMDTDDIVRD